jgi:putative peptidoglycan lipid II flippase
VRQVLNLMLPVCIGLGLINFNLLINSVLGALVKITAAAAALGAVAYVVWWGLDDILGRGLVAQIVSVGTALGAGTMVYAGLVLLLRVPEAAQIERLVLGRFRAR